MYTVLGKPQIKACSNVYLNNFWWGWCGDWARSSDCPDDVMMTSRSGFLTTERPVRQRYVSDVVVEQRWSTDDAAQRDFVF